MSKLEPVQSEDFSLSLITVYDVNEAMYLLLHQPQQDM